MHGGTSVDSGLGEVIRKATVKGGLPVYVLPKKGFNKKYATFATKYGSVDVRFEIPETGEVLQVPDGIAHFLEHKLFEEEFGNVFDEFARLGASTNAYTTYTTTTYLFSTTDNFYECLRILVDFVQRPYFTDENVEKEKSIIEQEIRMYEDMPEVRVGSNLMRALYVRHPVRIDVVGTVESVRRITKEMLYKCYQTFYHPSNMALFVVGDVDPDRVFDEVAGRVKESKPRTRPITRFFPEEPGAVGEHLVVQNMVVATPLIEMGFKDPEVGLGGRALLRKEVATRVLLEVLFGRGSEVYAELYEEGLLNDKFGSAYEAELEFAASFIGGESREPERLRDRLLGYIRKAKQNGLDRDAIERARRKLMGEFVSLFNSPEKLAYRFNAYHFKGINLFEYLEALREVTPEGIEERLNRHFDEERHAVSVIYPIR